MLAELSREIDTFINTSRHYMPQMLKAMGILWAFNIVNWMIGSPLLSFGIRPRKLSGLIGIFFAPFLHGNATHLLFNSVPLFFLGIFVLSFQPSLFYAATLMIMVLSGLGVWLVGRRGVHIGASALITGYFAYVLLHAYEQPTFTSFFAAGVVIYYFGGLFSGLFPSTKKETSWEGHLSGFFAGLFVSFLCTNYSSNVLFYWKKFLGYFSFLT